MKEHIENSHTDQQHICNICGTTFKNNPQLQRHLNIHKGIRGSACEVRLNSYIKIDGIFLVFLYPLF